MTITRLNPEYSKVQTGSVTVTGVGTSEVEHTVTFPSAYSSAPRVVVALTAASANRRIHAKNITATGFTLCAALLSGSSTASVWAQWVAVGK